MASLRRFSEGSVALTQPRYPHVQSMSILKAQFTNPAELLAAPWVLDLSFLMGFAGANTSTCESQRSLPVGVRSPSITGARELQRQSCPTRHATVSPEVRSGEVPDAQPAAGMAARCAVPRGLGSTQQTAPSRASCRR